MRTAAVKYEEIISKAETTLMAENFWSGGSWTVLEQPVNQSVGGVSVAVVHQGERK